MFIYLAQTSFKIYPDAAPKDFTPNLMTWMPDDQTGARIVKVSFAQKQAQKRLDELKKADALKGADQPASSAFPAHHRNDEFSGNTIKKDDQPAPFAFPAHHRNGKFSGKPMNQPALHKRNQRQRQQQELKRETSSSEANREANRETWTAVREDLGKVQLHEELRDEAAMKRAQTQTDQRGAQGGFDYNASIMSDIKRWKGAVTHKELRDEAAMKRAQTQTDQRGAQGGFDYNASIMSDIKRWKGAVTHKELRDEAAMKRAQTQTDQRGAQGGFDDNAIIMLDIKRWQAAVTSSSLSGDPKRKQEKNHPPKDSGKKRKPKQLSKATPELIVVDEMSEVQSKDSAKVIIPRPVSETVQEEIEAIRAAHPSPEATASNSATASGSVAISSNAHSPKLNSTTIFVNALIKARMKVLERRAGDYSSYIGQDSIRTSREPVAYARSILGRRRDTGWRKRREAVNIIQELVAKNEPKTEARL
jgi:hypothetical protein